MKILIAEDQPPAALYLRRTLEKMGHEVTVAFDGEQAWQIIQQGDSPLLISDWMMPNLNGPDLCGHSGWLGAIATPTSFS